MQLPTLGKPGSVNLAQSEPFWLLRGTRHRARIVERDGGDNVARIGLVQPRMIRQVAGCQSFVRIHGQQALGDLFREAGQMIPRLTVKVDLACSDSGGQVRRACPERRLLRQYGVQNSAQTPKVAALVVTLPGHYLRRRVRKREARSVQRLAATFHPGEAKVHDLHWRVLTFVHEHDVLGLQISMNHASRMHETHRRGELPHYSTRLLLAERPRPPQQLSAGQQLQHQVRVRPVLMNLDQLHHVRVALASLQQTGLSPAIDPTADDLHSELLRRLSVPAFPTHGETTVSQRVLQGIQLVRLEERGLLESACQHVRRRGPLTLGAGLRRFLEDILADHVVAEQYRRRHVRVTAEDLVVVGRDHGRAVGRDHLRELVREVAGVQLVSDPRYERRRDLASLQRLPAERRWRFLEERVLFQLFRVAGTTAESLARILHQQTSDKIANDRGQVAGNRRVGLQDPPRYVLLRVLLALDRER